VENIQFHEILTRKAGTSHEDLCTGRSCFMPGVCYCKTSRKSNTKFPFKTVCSLMGFTISSSFMYGSVENILLYILYSIFMYDLQEVGWGAWTGLIWIKIGTGGGPL
jgi:hypothetical protein